MASDCRVRRLTSHDRDVAVHLFVLMANVFEEGREPLAGTYVERLLARQEFWALAAFVDDDLVGGLTAHTLPMTRSESSEIFIFDIAVRPEHQRQGVGRALVASLRELAAQPGIDNIFVPAENEDAHALDFYRALGGVAAAVTIFTFSRESDS